MDLDEKPLPIEVELTQQERVQLLTVLPQKGDIATVRTVRMLRDSVNLQPNERPRFGGPGQPQVVPQPIPPKTFSFTKTTHSLIKDQMKILSDMKNLPVDYLELYDKFVEKGD